MENKKRVVEVGILIILLILIANFVGLNRILISNFNPINGDFQNYNPIRRLLDGQIPYKDFAVYLGSGHLFLLSFIQMIIGNNFTLSLFNTNMITTLLSELTVFTISALVLKNKRQALYITVMGAIFNLFKPKWITKFLSEEFLYALYFSIAPGNSARLIRNAISIIVVLLLFLGMKWLNQSQKKWIVNHRAILKKIYWAIIGGTSIAWSNDGGIATYIATSFIYFVLLIKEYKTNIKSVILYTLMYIGISITTLLIVLTLITRGNPASWLQFTFGVSSYQKWYYGKATDKTNISLANLDFRLNNIIMIGIAIFYLYKIWKTKGKEEILRYALLVIIVMSPILSSYIYQLLSGGKAREMLDFVLLILIVVHIFMAIRYFLKAKMVVRILKIMIVLISCILVTYKTTIAVINIANREETIRGVYIEELGGYFTKLGDSIIDAMNRIGDSKIFSTYASAIDVATNQFQPTGTDYIIHCLGDEQRKNYMEIFKKGEFDYVTTTDRDYNEWRFWIRNANWFFYQELYKTYKPVFATEYNVFWKKAENPKTITQKTEIRTEKQDDSTYNIYVETDDKNFDGIVNVKLAYQSKFKNFLKNLVINRYVMVQDITGKELTDSKKIDYNIPNTSQTYYVPVTIIDGAGEIQISSYPATYAQLEISKAEVVECFDVNLKYCVLTKAKEIEGNTVYIDNTKENRVILKDVKAIKIGGKTEEKVINMSEQENFITLQLEKNAQAFAYPNFFEVIK